MSDLEWPFISSNNKDLRKTFEVNICSGCDKEKQFSN